MISSFCVLTISLKETGLYNSEWASRTHRDIFLCKLLDGYDASTDTIVLLWPANMLVYPLIRSFCIIYYFTVFNLIV